MDWQNLQEEQDELHQLIDRRFKQLLNEVGPEIHVNQNDLCRSVYDGCLDVEKYVRASKRILWILKEHNGRPPVGEGRHCVAFGDALGNDEDKHVKQFKANVSTYRSLRLIERSSAELLGGDNDNPTETYKSIAIANLGKCPGESKTPAKRLPKLAEWWGEILVRQVKIYSPEVIIVPGSHFSHVKSLFGGLIFRSKSERKTGKYAARAKLYDLTGTPVVHIQHPSWYGCREEDWINAIRDVLKKWNAGRTTANG